MLIEQKKITASTQKRADEEKARREETESKLQELDATYQRLRKKLDDKDAKIHALRAKIEEITGITYPESAIADSEQAEEAPEETAGDAPGTEQE